jgi:hypothetical protein
MPPAERPLVIASSRAMADTLATFSGARVARALHGSGRTDALLRDAADHALPWVAVLPQVATHGFVDAAHLLGVKVLVFANAPDARLPTASVDAVILEVR